MIWRLIKFCYLLTYLNIIVIIIIIIIIIIILSGYEATKPGD